MRVALVINPGSGSIDDPQDVVDMLRAAGAEDVARFGLGEEENAAATSPDRMVVAGGDGTIAPCALAAARAGVPLVVLPAGTANDFARALDLPLDLPQAVALAVAPDARTRDVEVCLTGEDRPFLNAANAGLAVHAAREAHGLKAVLGPLAYTLGAARAGLTAPAIDVDVTLDDDPFFRGPAWQVIVSGTGRFGGGSAVGETDQDDGLLDVTVVPAGPRLALARRAFGLRRGTLREQDAVHHARGRTARVRMGGERKGRGFNVDGELLTVASLEVRMHPQRVRVVVP